MLDEVVNSTIHRCLEPELMEPSVSFQKFFPFSYGKLPRLEAHFMTSAYYSFLISLVSSYRSSKNSVVEIFIERFYLSMESLWSNSHFVRLHEIVFVSSKHSRSWIDDLESLFPCARCLGDGASISRDS